MNRWRVCPWAVLVMALSLSLAACGSPEGKVATATPPLTATPPPVTERTAIAPSPTPTSSPPPPTQSTPVAPQPAASREIRVTLKENTFPKEIRVQAGETVVFVITNEGKETHDFEFPDFDVHEEIKPGQTVRVEWVVPNKKGKWDMGCFRTEEGFHEDMEGILIIE